MLNVKSCSFPERKSTLLPSLSASLISALLLCHAPTALAQVNFVSTQLRPVDEADKVRNVILKGAPTEAKFIPEETGPMTTRLLAEAAAGKGSVGLVAGLDSELEALVSKGALADVDSVSDSLGKTRRFNAKFLAAGKYGSANQKMIPWMYTSFIMVANTKAMPYLPKGADVNALTYDQLKQWAKAIKEATGEAKLGFPAGPRGLMHRFFQGYLYPSYTGGMVTNFRTPEAQKMWTDFKDLWQYVHPRSTSYGFMEEPLSSGEVWIAFDHTARLLTALKEKPTEFVTFPAPAGPKGRGYMLVLAGLAIPKTSPDMKGAEAIIDHLTNPKTQATTLMETGFYPAVQTLGIRLPEGVQMAANALNNQSTSADGKPATIPVGLGAKGGEFNKFYLDTFQRIILKNEDIATVLKSQGDGLKGMMDEAKVPCWAPDVTPKGSHCTFN